MIMKHFKLMFKLVFLSMLFLMITNCADFVIYSYALPLPSGEFVGFWHGFWHGFIILFSFIISVFSDNVAIYAIYQEGTGVWYDFGFVLGIITYFKLVNQIKININVKKR